MSRLFRSNAGLTYRLLSEDYKLFQIDNILENLFFFRCGDGKSYKGNATNGGICYCKFIFKYAFLCMYDYTYKYTIIYLNH